MNKNTLYSIGAGLGGLVVGALASKLASRYGVPVGVQLWASGILVGVGGTIIAGELREGAN